MERRVLRQKRRFDHRDEPAIGGRYEPPAPERANDRVEPEEHQRYDEQREDVFEAQIH
jgi:hypothetical protein